MAEDMDSVERRGCMITDHYNRNIDYIRISITDRCNLRCRYCMPEDIRGNYTDCADSGAAGDYKGKDYRWGAVGAARMYGSDP